jgi:hypothetical protein
VVIIAFASAATNFSELAFTFIKFLTVQILDFKFWILVKQRGLGGFPHERLLNPKGLGFFGSCPLWAEQI